MNLNGASYVYENGTQMYANFTSYVPGTTKWRIARTGGNIVYSRNGVVVRTVAETNPNAPMVVDITIWNTGTVDKAKVYQLKVGKLSQVLATYASGDYVPYVHSDYRFGYTGKEKDPEMKGDGNSYDFGNRQYDPRLGRWMTLDPMKGLYPSMSPYCYAGNTPIVAKDPDGNFIIFINGFTGGVYGDVNSSMASEPGKNYWKNQYQTGFPFIDAAMTYFGDNSDPMYLDGSDGKLGLSKAAGRYQNGYDQGVADAAAIKKRLEEAEEAGNCETIKILTHSMGAAYAEGFVEALIDQGINPDQIEKIVHLSSCDASDITISEKAKGIRRVQLGVDKDNTLFVLKPGEDRRRWVRLGDPFTTGKDRMISGADVYGEIHTDKTLLPGYSKKKDQARMAQSHNNYDYHAYTKWEPGTFDMLRELEHGTLNYQNTYEGGRTYFNITFGNDKFRWNSVKRGSGNTYLKNVNKDGTGHNYTTP